MDFSRAVLGSKHLMIQKDNGPRKYLIRSGYYYFYQVNAKIALNNRI